MNKKQITTSLKDIITRCNRMETDAQENRTLAQELLSFVQYVPIPDEEDEEPEPPVEEPEPPQTGTIIGLEGETVPQMIERARAQYGNYKLGYVDDIRILLPAGDLPAFTLGIEQNQGDDYAYMNWIGTARLVLRGHEDGTRLMPSPAVTGVTVLLNTQPSWRQRNGGGDPSWSGRVSVASCTIFSSTLACVQTIGPRATSDQSKWIFTPYEEVTFSDCVFRDHPDVSVSPKWVMILHHAAVNLLDCDVHTDRIKEHVIYSHNPCGGSQIIGNTVTGCGGNFLQYVSRNTEGPSYGPSLVEVIDNKVSGWANQPYRASNCITIAGSGQDWTIKNNEFTDMVGADHAGGESFGCIVVWNEGGRFNPMASGAANGKIVIRDNVMGGVNQNRACVDVQDCELLVFELNYLFAKELNVETDLVRSYRVVSNNIPNEALSDRLGYADAWFRLDRSRAQAVPLLSVDVDV